MFKFFTAALVGVALMLCTGNEVKAQQLQIQIGNGYGYYSFGRSYSPRLPHGYPHTRLHGLQYRYYVPPQPHHLHLYKHRDHWHLERHYYPRRDYRCPSYRHNPWYR